MYGSTSSSAPLSGKTRRLVADSMAVMGEADEMGTSILGQLRDQRESIVKTQDRVGDMQQLTGQTRKTLVAMDRKACMELACLYATIVVLVVLIGVVACREITNHGHLF
ncbi:hypothetical protein JKP88DRAFT_238306 [Tribonema minus]|uniref:Uncharacterized protein n=1 Tax=Tribonema minus TaxID=303371 RepID=A0A836CH72_9STRA|nr:hypothetical protein JKP88DRAFT_238306 [Tribonema minus]